MALSQPQLIALSRLGGSKVATLQPDGSAVAVHPALDSWYAAAIADESSAAWLALYTEAMCAKTAHLCLKFPWNDDGASRGVVTAEPLNGSPGNRSYTHDYTDAQWWRSTQAGAYYHSLRARIGTKAGPFLCI